VGAVLGTLQAFAIVAHVFRARELHTSAVR
jgi:hypothetical protein